MSLKMDRDHWAFLDEIEAPMWVNLTEEARGNYTDVDDGWFRTSHQYHQCPSLELKAVFAYSGEASASSGIDVSGQSSPKLPSSVSGSRGKPRKSKRQKEADYVFPWIKKHPVKVLSGKSSWISGSGEEIKPKASFINSKGTWRPKRSVGVERDLTGNAKENNFKAISNPGDSKGSLSCMEHQAVDSNTSTITSDNEQKIQPKNLEVSSQAFGHSNGLLSALRTSLRKSCVTRQASRVDVSKKESRDSNSASGNSSVGSSSKPCYKNSTFQLKQQREQIADSRNEARTTRVIRSKVKDSTLSKVSDIQVKEGTRNSRPGRINNGSKPDNHNATKPKAQNQMVRAKALMPLGVNEQHSSHHAAKAQKMVAHNRLVSTGNENKTGRLLVNQKGNGGYITTGVMARGPKGTKQDTLFKGNRSRLTGPKEKVSSPRSKRGMTTERVYLR
ncbi:uncharacterized protein [Euphorbia lathyris]|uniref:uncharacterized protein n=1 Tax=Euphorbia lathyris TaxID=212925 RepID=UPI0033133747